MSRILKITYGEIELFNAEVGKFSWSETQTGGITVSGEPPRAAGAPNPALQGLSDALKNKAQNKAPA